MKRITGRAASFITLASSFTLMLLLASSARVFAQAPLVPQDIITVGVQPGLDTPLEDAVLSNIGTIVNHDKECSDYVLKLLPGLDRALTLTLLLARPEIRYVEGLHSGSSMSIPVPSDYLYTHPYGAGLRSQYGPQRVQADLAWNIWQPHII